MHAQLQQVFIRKVFDVLAIGGDDDNRYKSQLVVTTHSPHILYESGFQPIRYFLRQSGSEVHTSEVLNLSAYYDRMDVPIRDFLERYMKLTHCDLFFADAAILVEGNVERLLLPEMIGKVAPRLQSTYCSILEVGGAYGFRFKSLIEFLGITTLIITDIDSVTPPVDADPPAQAADEEEEGDEAAATGKACKVCEPGAITSNQTLIQWLPRLRTICELLAATPEQRTQARTGANQALIRVAYQTAVSVTWGEQTRTLTGRTLEEAFALENFALCQGPARTDLRLSVRGNATMEIEEVFEQVPTYIAEGLRWLEGEVAPPAPAAPPIAPAAATAARPS
jgi:hypothetical protein